MTTKQTKKSRAFKWIFWLLSFLCNFGLVIAFTVYGLVMAAPAATYGICLTGIVGAIVALTSAILKKHWRTPLVLLLGGLYFAISNYAVVLITVGVAIVLDELIFAPLYEHFREKTSINVEIDKRI